jgi:hypothetical protein
MMTVQDFLSGGCGAVMIEPVPISTLDAHACRLSLGKGILAPTTDISC